MQVHPPRLYTLSIAAAALIGGVMAAPALASASWKGGTGASAGNKVGSLSVIDSFLPQPASSDVASIYLTVKNSGSRPDALISVSSAAASGSMMMTDNRNGTMGMLRELRIPAHGKASLTPGRDHLMLEQPRHSLSVGQHVTVTLRFQHAGLLTISVPVVPLSRMLEHS